MTAFVRWFVCSISFVRFSSFDFVRSISFVRFRSFDFVRLISFVRFRSFDFVRCARAAICYSHLFRAVSSIDGSWLYSLWKSVNVMSVLRRSFSKPVNTSLFAR